MDPASASAALIHEWGAPGAIIVVLLIAIAWLSANLKDSINGRLIEQKASLDAKYKDSAETRDLLRDLKTAVDASTRTMETAIAVMRVQVKS